MSNESGCQRGSRLSERLGMGPARRPLGAAIESALLVRINVDQAR
jgi:hypothetical protein